MSSPVKNNKFEKLSDYVISQFSEISSLVENCKEDELTVAPEKIHENVQKELEAIDGENSEFSVSKLSELFKSIDQVPPILQKSKRTQNLSRTNSNVAKDDMSESRQTWTEHDKLENVPELLEDFRKTKGQYETFLKKIAKNQEKIDHCYSEVQKLNSSIEDLQKLLPSQSRSSPYILNPQQEKQVEKLNRDTSDFIYIQQNQNVYAQVEEQNNLAENLEIIIPIVNELLQNITIN